MINVHEYYEKMNEDNVMLAFKGGVTADLLTSILQIAETKLERIEAEPKTKKKIFNILVECFQNVYHHYDSPEIDEDTGQSAILMIGKDTDDYVIMTGNHVSSQNVDKLKERLELVNSLSPEELKKLYREILNNEEISDKGGAGLGMIDIVRRSGKKLEYDFTDVDDKHSYFSLQVRVPA